MILVRHSGLRTLACMAFLLLAAGRRLNAGERAPEFELRGPSGETARYTPPRAAPEGTSAGVVTILLFMDYEQELSRKALDDLSACLEKTPGPASRRIAFAIAVGGLNESNLAAFAKLLPPKGAVRAALDPKRTAYRDYGVIALPTTFVIDTGGSILSVLPGHPASYRKRIAASLRKALGIESVQEEGPRRSPEAEHARRIAKLAGTLAARGSFDLAKGQLRTAIEITPSDPGLRIQLGEVLLRLDDVKDAAGAFRKALELDPKSRTARIGLAKAISLGEDLEAGEKALRSELGRGKAEADLFYYLGRLLERKGDVAAAAAAYRRAYERTRGTD